MTVGRVTYETLGVRRVINVAAMQTALGGSLMPPAVRDAMAHAAGAFVSLDELHDRVGERIATLTRNDAACVVNGAAAGVMLATAACRSGGGSDRRRDEVLIVEGQRNGYLIGVEAAGGKVRGVDNEAALRSAIGPRTACVLLFAGEPWESNAPRLEDLVSAARDGGVPVIIDAADQIPPFSSTWRYTRELNATAVVFSGGKGLYGPQSSGLVLGERDIVDACRRLSAPRYGIGRTGKVGKEEMLGLLAAVEIAARSDEAEQRARYASIAKRFATALTDLPGFTVALRATSHSGQPIPRTILVAPTRRVRDALVEGLWDLDPRIAVLDEGERDIALNPQQVRDDEVEHVIRMVHAVLERIPPDAVIRRG